jgi:squalene-associated FAD-dependent desaturase
MPRVIVAGGGLAGLAAAAALGSAGYEVELLESRAFLGGRATSYPLPASDSGEVIDNCQHVLLRCCVNLLDFYRRLGVEHEVKFHREFYYLEPGGRLSVLKAGTLPAPLHFTGSFLKFQALSLADKISIGRGLLAMRKEYRQRTDLDQITMTAWLREKKQTQRAIDRFWGPVLVSAINEDLDRMAAVHGLQVFWLGFMASANSYEMGIPSVPLGELYSADKWSVVGNVKLRMRCTVEEFSVENGAVASLKTNQGALLADAYVCALPFERVAGLDLNVSGFEHSPITGIHLWFDRSITSLPHAVLLDRTIQWMFNKCEGRYIQLVVSASRGLTTMPRAEVIDLALRELGEFLPAVRDAKLEKAHVVKEMRATFSAAPGLELARPLSKTPLPNLFLAGDWTRSGWPATMEGAVRSGYLAAEAVTGSFGRRVSFLVPDIA